MNNLNPKLPELIAYIVNDVVEKTGECSKEKLLMLLYLFDVEYYRKARTTWTGFQWIHDSDISAE